jgi:hypothetical protein
MATDMIDLSSLEATDTTQTETESVETQHPETQTAEIQPGNQETQQAQVSEDLSGKSIRDAVKQLAAANPAHAKILRQLADTHFREATGWKGAFETPQKAAEAKSIIESAGGIEGISQATQRLQTYDMQDAGLKEGNPEVLDAMFKDFPEGAAALAPHYLERLQKMNPEAYGAAVGPHAVQMLKDAQIPQFVQGLLAETDPARIKAGLTTMDNWLKGQMQNADAVKNTAKPAPGTDKLKERETQLNQREEGIFRSAVQTKVNDSIQAPMKSLVDQYVKANGWNEKQAAYYRTALENAVIEEMNGDNGYKQQIDLRFANKQRTHDTVATYAAGEFSRRAKDKALEVSKECKNLFGSSGKSTATGTGAVKPGQPKTAPGGGPLQVSSIPTNEQLDTSRPDFTEMRIKGQGYLKNGMFVSWAHLRGRA